jgi:hypothetical protein
METGQMVEISSAKLQVKYVAYGADEVAPPPETLVLAGNNLPILANSDTRLSNELGKSPADSAPKHFADGVVAIVDETVSQLNLFELRFDFVKLRPSLLHGGLVRACPSSVFERPGFFCELNVLFPHLMNSVRKNLIEPAQFFGQYADNSVTLLRLKILDQFAANHFGHFGFAQNFTDQLHLSTLLIWLFWLLIFLHHAELRFASVLNISYTKVILLSILCGENKKPHF